MSTSDPNKSRKNDSDRFSQVPQRLKQVNLGTRKMRKKCRDFLSLETDIFFILFPTSFFERYFLFFILFISQIKEKSDIK